MPHADRTAAALARRFLEIVSAQDESAVSDIFDPEIGCLEMAYPLDDITGDAMKIVGRQIASFQRNAFAVTESCVFHDIEADEITDELAYLRYRSTARFRNGVTYENYYCTRVTSRAGRILHWLEYFDPRPAERFRAVMAEEVARKRAGATDGAR